MRDEVFHIQWIDLTMNDFDNETQTVSTIINAIKKQTKMIYVGLTVQGNQGDILARGFLTPQKPAYSKSINMRNSRLSLKVFDYMARCMLH